MIRTVTLSAKQGNDNYCLLPWFHFSGSLDCSVGPDVLAFSGQHGIHLLLMVPKGVWRLYLKLQNSWFSPEGRVPGYIENLWQCWYSVKHIDFWLLHQDIQHLGITIKGLQRSARANHNKPVLPDVTMMLQTLEHVLDFTPNGSAAVSRATYVLKYLQNQDKCLHKDIAAEGNSKRREKWMGANRRQLENQWKEAATEKLCGTGEGASTKQAEKGVAGRRVRSWGSLE